jgi:hypothetical protein
MSGTPDRFGDFANPPSVRAATGQRTQIHETIGTGSAEWTSQPSQKHQSSYNDPSAISDGPHFFFSD